MAIRVRPPNQEYLYFLSNGGQVTFEIEPTDITPSRDFEESAAIKPHLDVGFELAPSPVILQGQDLGTLYLFGSSWDSVVASVYRRRGSITYRRISPDRYQATCKVPTGNASSKSHQQS